MRTVSSARLGSLLARLVRHDTFVQLYLAVVAAEAVIYSVPLMDPGTLTAFGASPFEIPFVATVVLTGFYGLRHVVDPEERLFWSHLAVAMVFWLATLVWIAIVPSGGWTVTHAVLVDASYLLFYSPILFAVERKPHVPSLGMKRREVERQLRWTGVTVLVVGWFVYFVVVPAAVEPAFFRTLLPSSLLFMTIDALVVFRFSWRAWSCGSLRWRVLYGTMALAGVSLFITDGLDASKAAGLLTLADGAITDLVWAVPPLLFLVAFRLREAELPQVILSGSQERGGAGSLDPVRVGAFLVVSALAFPVVHILLHVFASFSPELLRAQRFVVLAEVLALASLAAVAYHRVLRDRQEVERGRRAQDERLRQARKLEAVSRVAGVVADEFTPPLQALGRIADRVLGTLAAGDPLRNDVQRAREHIHRLSEFTRNLSAVSRQQRGRPVRVDLAEAVAEALPALANAVGPQVRIETLPAPGCLTMIDPAHLRVILLDLATNARDAMPGGGRLRLETGLVDLDADAALALTLRPGRYARLLVRDTGDGIPHDIMMRLFEPFSSTKAGGSRSGSGLGLATLYAIVSQNGGCVTATSEPGQGASFEILLPSA